MMQYKCYVTQKPCSVEAWRRNKPCQCPNCQQFLYELVLELREVNSKQRESAGFVLEQIETLCKELDHLQKAVVRWFGWEPGPVGATFLGEAVNSARDLLNKMKDVKKDVRATTL
jgi:hypothetical protein